MSFAQFRLRRDTAAEWLAHNPILALGELALELPSKKYKIGNGVDPWSDLDYGGLEQTEKETLTVHLSDNVTPVAPTTAVEYYFLEYNLDLTGVGFKSPFQAPTGSSAIVRALWNADGDVNGAFTNIFTSADALTIPAGSTSVGLLVPNTTFLTSGGVLRFDIQQVGATNTGRGFRVTLQGTRS